MTPFDYWLAGGWRYEVMVAYETSLCLAVLSALAVALGPFLVSGLPRSAWGRFWRIPILLWALSAMAAGFGLRDMCFTGDAVVSPYVWIGGLSAVLAGVVVLLLSGGSAAWSGAIQPVRRGVVFTLVTWGVVGIYWAQTLVRVLFSEATAPK